MWGILLLLRRRFPAWDDDDDNDDQQHLFPYTYRLSFSFHFFSFLISFIFPIIYFLLFSLFFFIWFCFVRAFGCLGPPFPSRLLASSGFSSCNTIVPLSLSVYMALYVHQHEFHVSINRMKAENVKNAIQIIIIIIWNKKYQSINKVRGIIETIERR